MICQISKLFVVALISTMSVRAMQQDENAHVVHLNHDIEMILKKENAHSSKPLTRKRLIKILKRVGSLDKGLDSSCVKFMNKFDNGVAFEVLAHDEMNYRDGKQ